jgi:hypothetical protein
MKRILFLSLAFIVAVADTTNAQTVKVPLSLTHLDTMGMKKFVVETYEGKESLIMTSGAFTVKGADVRDGIIEADISFPNQRGFPGFAFRVQDINNFENFYVRPHQSGNPDATQYTPIFNGLAGWQLYHGEGYSSAIPFRHNQWHHVKIDFHGLQAEIYIDDMQTPLIKVKELLTGWKGGTIGIISGGLPLRVADLQYTVKPGSQPATIPTPANGSEGMITKWEVSNALNKNLFEKTMQLTSDIKSKITWTTRTSEFSGVLNLARHGKLTETTNAMVAKVVIESEVEQLKALSFGFSDFVTVYLNDKALYAGADNFLSRDYRYLGTIGYFDTLVLPLKKGTNELWFVVSENFGGWGVKAKFVEMERISLK